MNQLSAWRKASFFDPDTGDVVQFNHLIPDQSSWKADPIKTEDTLGSVYGGREYALEVGAVDIDGDKQDLLRQWTTAATPIQAAVANMGGKNVLWQQGEDLFFTPPAATKASDGAAPGQCQLYYTGVGSAITERRNLLGGSQTVVFPVANLPLTASFTAGAASSGMTVLFRDYDGKNLASHEISGPKKNKRYGGTFSAPAGTWEVKLKKSAGAISDPALRTDGSREYTGG
jgi:hypothetical protein